MADNSANRKVRSYESDSLHWTLQLQMLSAVLAALLISTSASGDAVEKCKVVKGGKGYCCERGECPNDIALPGSCPSDKICCPISEISSKKCHEYSRYVYSIEQSAVLLPTSRSSNVSQCRIEAVPLVVGGVKAHEMEFPHMAAIGYGKSKETAEWLCGGSLISERFVLTAAHCSKNKDRGPAIFARLGELDFGDTGDGSNVQDFIIVERIIHPEYTPPSRYHDIALFKLSGFVEMSGYVRPACLHTIPNETSLKEAIATGWGKLNYNDKTRSDHLMKVTLDIIDYAECNKSFEADVGGKTMHHGVSQHQLCAGHLGGGKDTCHGDSGGPLQVVSDDPYCMYDVIGITSFGKFCGFRNSPAVYTRVSHYVPWIESVVWP